MAKKVDLNYTEYICKSYAEFKSLVCACCLGEDVRLIKLNSCKHTPFFDDIHDFVNDGGIQYVCVLCHRLLIKFSLFRDQVRENVQSLLSRTSNLKSKRNVLDLKCVTNDIISLTPNKTENIKEEYFVDVESGSNSNVDSREEIFILKDIIKEEWLDYDAESVPEIEDNSLCEVRKKNTRRDKLSNDDLCEETSRGHRQRRGAEKPPSSSQESHENLSIYEGKIRALVLSEDEFQKERETERRNPAYLKMEYKCEDCIVGFNHRETLEDHVKARHALKPGGATCSICKSCLTSATTHKMHMQRHYRRYECMLCLFRSKCQAGAERHYNIYHEKIEEKLYRCLKCDFTTNEKRSYRYHMERHRQWDVECDVCGARFAIRSTLKNHKLAMHGKNRKKYHCSKCNKYFTYKSGLSTHERNVHAVRSAPVYCVQCDKYFKCEATLKIHLNTTKSHIGEHSKGFVCDHCNAKFVYKSQVRAHILRQHFPDLLPKCHVCDKSFSTRKVMERHVETVHNKKKMPKNKMCDYCGKGFTTNVLLRVHIRTHTGERPLRCGECGVSFAHPSALRTHKKLKHENRPK